MNNVFTDKKFDEEARNWLISLLNADYAEVEFLKKDGTLRKMKCTLNEGKIPKDKLPKGSSSAKSNDAIAVYDLENEGWRSFRWDSIKSVILS